MTRPVIGLIALLGCAGQTRNPAVEVIVRDSAGVTIIENPTDLSDLPLWRIDSVPILRMVNESAGPSSFRSLDNAFRFPNGSLIAADRQPAQVRLFDSTGTFVRIVAREGAGPGEIKCMGHVDPFGRDTFYLMDPCQDRVLILDGQARVLGTFISPAPGAEGSGIEVPLQMISSTEAIIPLRHWPICPAKYCRDLTPVLKFTTARATPETLTVVRGPETYDGGRDVYLGAAPSMDVGGDGFYLADGADPEVKQFDRKGRLRRVIRWKAVPRAYPDHDQKKASAGGFVIAPRIPEVAGLIAAENGDLWVDRRPDDYRATGPYVIFDSTGRAKARLEIPPKTWLLQVPGQFVVLLRQNDDDENFIEVARIIR